MYQNIWSRFGHATKTTPSVAVENLDWLLTRHHKQITDTSVSNYRSCKTIGAQHRDDCPCEKQSREC